tara:strand:+ start:128 stop:772 length:645 start_codon:yes stop_codon:yes gene_type:complete
MFTIYIIHYKKLIDRKKAILTNLKKLPYPFEFIDKYDRDNLKTEDLSYFTNDKDNIHKSIFLSHIEAYKRHLKSRDKFSLVLEDDSIPNEVFKNNNQKYIKELPSDFDLFFISPGKNNFHIPIYLRNPFKKVHRKKNIETRWGGHGASRCADAYFISDKCAKKLYDEFYYSNIKIDTSIDWWMNLMIDKYKLKVYWAQPTIIETNKYVSAFDIV